VDAFDRLIERELAHAGQPQPVPFAPKVLDDLTARGFEREEALRYFALFFQLRRAYYFIDRALVGPSPSPSPSPSMAELRRGLWDSVFTRDARLYDRHLWSRMEDFAILLLGETGTGKGAAAAAVGRSGFIPFDPSRGRFAHDFDEAFVATNLSQFSPALLESELFGHRKGAFTGAIDHHQGLFEPCRPHGTLFLDEIGELDQAVQIKLLKVLQERRFTPVGSHEDHRFSGRIIAAANRSLAALQGQGGFRDDFYYRLSSLVLTVPPFLRQRIAECPAELEQLVALLLRRMIGSADPALTRHLLDTLRRDLPADHPWPGNVRELEHAIRRILLSGHYRPTTPYRCINRGRVACATPLFPTPPDNATIRFGRPDWRSSTASAGPGAE